MAARRKMKSAVTTADFSDLPDCERWFDEFKLPEDMCKTVLENSAVAITVTNEIENIVFWNRAAEILLGMNKKDLLLKPVRLLYPAEEWERIRAQDLRQKGIQHHMETVMITKSKDMVDVDLSLSMLEDDAGNVIGSVGVMKDISDRKKAERQLHAAEERYRTIFENSAVAITLVDENENIVAWNRHTESLLGMDGNDLHMRPVRSLYPEEEWHALRSMNVRQKGIDHHTETRMIKKNEDIVDVDLSLSVLRGLDGKVTGSVGIITDITVRKQAERARDELDRLKSEFVAITSHELKAPVQGIMGSARLMLAGKVTDPERQEEFLTIIDQQAKRLTELINDILDVSRMESGRFSIHKNPASVANVIHDAVSEVGGLASEKAIAVATDVPSSLPEVQLDENRVKQVLVNLLSNGIKFSDSGTEITVKAKCENDELLVEVTDHGMGIPETAIPHLFERFYQVDGSITRARTGSGLGLYISRQIVEAHDGRIWTESEVGKGSTFTFSVPCA